MARGRRSALSSSGQQSLHSSARWGQASPSSLYPWPITGRSELSHGARKAAREPKLVHSGDYFESTRQLLKLFKFTNTKCWLKKYILAYCKSKLSDVLQMRKALEQNKDRNHNHFSSSKLIKKKQTPQQPWIHVSERFLQLKKINYLGVISHTNRKPNLNEIKVNIWYTRVNLLLLVLNNNCSKQRPYKDDGFFTAVSLFCISSEFTAHSKAL